MFIINTVCYLPHTHVHLMQLKQSKKTNMKKKVIIFIYLLKKLNAIKFSLRTTFCIDFFFLEKKRNKLANTTHPLELLFVFEIINVTSIGLS